MTHEDRVKNTHILSELSYVCSSDAQDCSIRLMLKEFVNSAVHCNFATSQFLMLLTVF